MLVPPAVYSSIFPPGMCQGTTQDFLVTGNYFLRIGSDEIEVLLLVIHPLFQPFTERLPTLRSLRLTVD